MFFVVFFPFGYFEYGSTRYEQGGFGLFFLSHLFFEF